MPVSARVAAAVVWLTAAAGAAADPPRFTPDREAAARSFVSRHLPEILPLLDQLKQSNRAAYEKQVRETFQVSELLADLQDDPKRHDLQLKLWKAENRAGLLVARLAAAKPDEAKGIETQLKAASRELTELELRGLEHDAAMLEKDLAAARDDVARARARLDQTAKARYESLVEKARQRRP